MVSTRIASHQRRRRIVSVRFYSVRLVSVWVRLSFERTAMESRRRSWPLVRSKPRNQTKGLLLPHCPLSLFLSLRRLLARGLLETKAADAAIDDDAAAASVRRQTTSSTQRGFLTGRLCVRVRDHQTNK